MESRMNGTPPWEKSTDRGIRPGIQGDHPAFHRRPHFIARAPVFFRSGRPVVHRKWCAPRMVCTVNGAHGPQGRSSADGR